EAMSKSKFWPKTCILVTEDDPQDGFDHVDGHRTVGHVISPYTKRKAVDSTCYNQTGMVKTIELILGLPPMTQLDLSATPMRGCFTDTPDLTPYAAAKNRVPLDEMNKPAAELKGKAKEFALKSLALDFDEEDPADRLPRGRPEAGAALPAAAGAEGDDARQPDRGLPPLHVGSGLHRRPRHARPDRPPRRRPRRTDGQARLAAPRQAPDRRRQP